MVFFLYVFWEKIYNLGVYWIKKLIFLDGLNDGNWFDGWLCKVIFKYVEKVNFM